MKKNKNYVDLKDQPVPEGQHLLEVDDLKMYFHTEDASFALSTVCPTRSIAARPWVSSVSPAPVSP